MVQLGRRVTADGPAPHINRPRSGHCAAELKTHGHQRCGTPSLASVTRACVMSDEAAVAVSVAEHCHAINALVDKLEHAERKVDEYQRAIGQHIAAVKEARPDDWQKVIEVECKLKRSRAYELLAIADGRKTVEQVRAEVAKRVRKHDERKREARPLANGQEATTAIVKVEQANDPAASAEAMKAELAVFDAAAEVPADAAPQTNTNGKALSRNQRRENAAAEGRRLASQLADQLERGTAHALHKFLQDDIGCSVSVLAHTLGRKLGIDQEGDDDAGRDLGLHAAFGAASRR